MPSIPVLLVACLPSALASLVVVSWFYSYSVVNLAIGPPFNSEVERVIAQIAEWGEAGEVAAVYRSITGFDDLERKDWRRPDWQYYFADGTIYRDLSPREMYLRHQDLVRLVKALPKLRHTPTKKSSRANISKFVDDYVRSAHPTKTGCREKWAAAGNGTRGRAILDEVYRDRARKAGISLRRGPRANSANS